jgi:acetyltransferase-like isoleucine patch superfamily enzyme
MVRKIYLSPLGFLISLALNIASYIHKPFMVYGYRDKASRQFRKRTRISSSAVLTDRQNIQVGDDVWIWHHSIVDGSGGVIIGDGVQIGGWCGIFTHGSQDALRLYGKSFIEIDRNARKGYTRGPVEIGPYCFIGAGSMLMPGTRLGKGCLVAVGTVVLGPIDDFSIVRGNPGRVVGDVRTIDHRYLDDPELRETYFDRETVAQWLETTRLATAQSEAGLS